ASLYGHKLSCRGILPSRWTHPSRSVGRVSGHFHALGKPARRSAGQSTGLIQTKKPTGAMPGGLCSSWTHLNQINERRCTRERIPSSWGSTKERRSGEVLD